MGRIFPILAIKYYYFSRDTMTGIKYHASTEDAGNNARAIPRCTAILRFIAAGRAGDISTGHKNKDIRRSTQNHNYGNL